MKKLNVYLDTSIISFLKADDAPLYKNATEILFSNVIVPNKIDTYISKVLLEEINNTINDEKRKILQELLDVYKNHFNMLVAENEKTDEISFLAEKYMEENIIPRKKVSDALHVAYSTVSFSKSIGGTI